MKIVYRPKKFTPAHTKIIEQATEICEEYAEQGFSLTLRQLYYQFVARGLIANKQTEYNRLGEIINDARMAGALDWEFLVDRTRNLVATPWWRNPQEVLKGAARSYAPDLWRPQHHRVEVWIEKDAGIGVIEGVCRDNHVPYFSCRGYTSSSELWSAAQRIGDHMASGDRVTILHIGDHDPSGVHMSQDLRGRLATFLTNDWNRSDLYRQHVLEGVGLLEATTTNDRIRRSMRHQIRESGGEIEDTEQPWRLKRIALTYEQVQQYDPPPNPAKTTDSRFAAYYEATGLDESWELDALAPDVLAALIQENIDACRNEDLWEDSYAQMESERAAFASIADHWDETVEAFGQDAPTHEDDQDETDEEQD